MTAEVFQMRKADARKEFDAREREICMEATRALWKHLLGAKITLADGRTMTVRPCTEPKLAEDGKRWVDENGVGELVVVEPKFGKAENWRHEEPEAEIEIWYDDQDRQCGGEYFRLSHC